MIEIKCLVDIANAEESEIISKELAEMLRKDLLTIKNYCDEDGEYSIETFHTEYTNNGHIAVVFGNESKEDLISLGLTGGLEETIPEAVVNCIINSVKWTRAVIIFNDSYGMILWIKNYDGFDSWEMPIKEIYPDGMPF